MSGTIVLNTSYEILTPTGWQDFLGVKKSFQATVKIRFTDGREVICTANHIFVDGNKSYQADSLRPKQRLNSRQVVSVTLHKVLDVYDPINVANGNLYNSSGLVSHNCQFLGSSGTLINASKIGTLAAVRPVYQKDGLDIFEEPVCHRLGVDAKVIPGKQYVLVADVSRGLGGDYSAFVVVDVSQMPYKLVAKYRDNMISPLLFPNVIHKVAKDYNNAYVLVEINENGQQIADILQLELEYQNILFITRGQGGQHLTAGFGSTSAVQNGVKTSAQVKRIGCDVFKTLVEEDKLLITDVDTISEISTFIQVKKSYEADVGYHDDLVMCLVLFGWLTSNPYFKDLTDEKFRERIFAGRMEDINSSLTPFIGFDDGQTNRASIFVDSAGNNWDLENTKEMMEEIGWLLRS